MENYHTTIDKAREVLGTPLIMARLFEKSKCKPWDLVKGKRFRCCHGLGEHRFWCSEGKPLKWEQIEFGSLLAGEL